MTTTQMGAPIPPKLIALLLLFACFLAFAHPAAAQWRDTPFGPAWMGDPAQRPAQTPSSAAAAAAPASAPAPAMTTPFVPTYETAYVTFALMGQTRTQVMNEWYFATADTAFEVCRRVMCAFVLEQPSASAGGIYSVSRAERWLMFPDGFKVNAGIVASYWTRNPEDKFPGVAQSLVTAQLKQDRK